MKIFLILVVSIQMLLAEDKQEKELNKLDASADAFFKKVTGIDDSYIDKQLERLQKQRADKKIIEKRTPSLKKQVVQIDKNDKELFRQERDISNITADLARSKQLKNIKIKSIYSLNATKYVVFTLDEKSKTKSEEATFNIEGRYKEGDKILDFYIKKIDLRIKGVKLFKKVNSKKGYYVYLTNNGTSLSNLVDLKKKPENIKIIKDKYLNEKFSNKEAKKILPQKAKKPNKIDKSNKKYEVITWGLNVRDSNSFNSKIVSHLKRNDIVYSDKQIGNWAHVKSLDKKSTNETLELKDKNYWIRNKSKYVKEIKTTSKNIIKTVKINKPTASNKVERDKALEVNTYIVKSYGLNIRESRSRYSKIPYYLERGDIIYSNFKKDKWLKVLKVDKLSSNEKLDLRDKNYWVSAKSKYVKKYDGTPLKNLVKKKKALVKKFEVISYGLNVRSSKSLKSKVVAHLEKGDILVVDKIEGIWIKISKMHKKKMHLLKNVKHKSYWIRNKTNLVKEI